MNSASTTASSEHSSFYGIFSVLLRADRTFLLPAASPSEPDSCVSTMNSTRGTTVVPWLNRGSYGDSVASSSCTVRLKSCRVTCFETTSQMLLLRGSCPVQRIDLEGNGEPNWV
jgi:hypothetical protein